MEPSTDLVKHVVVGAIAAGVVLVLSLLARRSPPRSQGWRHLTPSALHWTGLVLGAALTSLFSYVLLFVGSSRADAAYQMTVLFWLLVAFGLGTIAAGLAIRTIYLSAVRWRGRTIAFLADGASRRQRIDDIAAMQTTLWGVRLRFADGSHLLVDPNAQGGQALIDAIAAHLDPEQTGTA